MNPKKRSLRAFALLIGSYAFLALLYILPYEDVFMFHRMASILYFIPAVCVYLYFNRRIIDPRTRRFLTGIGAMIIFWFVLRAAKYIAFTENPTIARFIWYMYYVPMFCIPQFSFMAALSVGRPRDRKLPIIHCITGAVTVLCILLVLLNDVHQRVFTFNPGFENWELDYVHRPAFWIMMVWYYVFFFSSTAILFYKSRLTESRRLVWIPILYLGIGILGLYLLNIGLIPQFSGKYLFEFPDLSCYTMGGFWILCSTIGLVPTNKGYGRLLEESSLAATITNSDYQTQFQSRTALPLSNEQLASEGPVSIDDDTLVYRRQVSGGYAYWQVDITDLNAINRELEEALERTAEESELIRHANKTKEKQAQIEAKSRVYDRIAARVLPQSQKIAELAAEVQSDPDKFEADMRIISIYAVYIKRIANLMLMATDDRIPLRELELALSETSRYLMRAGIPAQMISEADDRTIDAETLIQLYEQFQSILQMSLPSLRALQIRLTPEQLKLTMEGEEISITDDAGCIVEMEDAMTFVSFDIRKAGDPV